MKSGGSWEVSAIGRDRSNHRYFLGNLQFSFSQRPSGGEFLTLMICLIAMLNVSGNAQTTLPFEVSNPKHLEWSTDEAERIYSSACELVARSLRPERPPRLTPKFVLVLGTQEDETLRDGPKAEVHLKTWNPARFAEAMVLMATREILKREDVSHLTRDTLMAAGASVSVSELKQKK